MSADFPFSWTSSSWWSRFALLIPLRLSLARICQRRRSCLMSGAFARALQVWLVMVSNRCGSEEFLLELFSAAGVRISARAMRVATTISTSSSTRRRQSGTQGLWLWQAG